MTKKDAIFPLVFVGLSFLFIIASLFVFFSKGKSAKWIARKMKIGGILLSLNAFTPVTAQVVEVDCYIVITEPNQIGLQNNQQELVFKKKSEKIVKAYIFEREGKVFSYCLTDSKGNKIKSDIIVPADGKFDSFDENFEIKLEMDLKPGKYFLYFFNLPIDKQELNMALSKMPVWIRK